MTNTIKLDVTIEVVEKLNLLRSKLGTLTGPATLAHVFRSALHLLESSLEAQEDGGSVVITDGEGTRRVVELLNQNGEPVVPWLPEKGVHSFEWALEQLKAGRSVTRSEAWQGCKLRLHEPDHVSDVCTEKFILTEKPDGRIFPWIPTTTALLATDWEIAE